MPKKSMFPFMYVCDACYNPIFHGAFDENIFIPIRTPQNGLERREQLPGGVQQEKLDFLFMMCDTS